MCWLPLEKRLASLAGILLVMSLPIFSDTTTINFDDLPENTVLSNQYSGVTFTEALVGQGSVYFPPHSGDNLAIALGYGPEIPTVLTFSTPIQSFSGYFTYEATAVITAFDSHGNQVAMTQGSSNSNLGCQVGPFPDNCGIQPPFPNEFLSVTYDGITSVDIAPLYAGSEVAFDDISFTTLDATPIPEPATGAMFATFVAGLFGLVPFGKRWHNLTR